MLLTRTDYSFFKQNNKIEIRFFIYQIQSIVFVQTAVADLSHNKNISRRIARLSSFFEIICACVNKAGVDTLGVGVSLRYV